MFASAKLLFRNFRSFRCARRISFVDPDTDLVRPDHRACWLLMSSGKTTVLESVEALLALDRVFACGAGPRQRTSEPLKSSFVDLILEFRLKI